MREGATTVTCVVAWGDMDAYHHVNNTVFLRWFENARIAWLERVGFPEREGRCGPVVRASSIEYVRPIEFPARVTVRVWASELGRSSVTLSYEIESVSLPSALASKGDESLPSTLAAQGTTTIVLVDLQRSTPLALPASARERIRRLDHPSVRETTGPAEPTRYEQPFLRGPTAPVAASSGPVPILGLEVVQAIQDLPHSVTLIAGKPTLVRVYLDPTPFTAGVVVRGELVWSRVGGDTYLASVNAVHFVAGSKPDLVKQRAELGLSLNFRLPPDALVEGKLRLEVKRLYLSEGQELSIAPQTATELTFSRSAPLRVRVVGLRYRPGPGQDPVAPDALHFAYLRSFLLRAYPTAEIVWSQIVVDANFEGPLHEDHGPLANAQLAAMRAQEVSAGMDQRTHYYGLVDDNGGQDFMRGLAFMIPDMARPDVVAAGPAGVPNGYFDDYDASYADWYGAHELGHTFGRHHPGFPLGEQDASDPEFPYPQGFISSLDGEFVGLDFGDATLELPMQVLVGTKHHDLMTYGASQWISKHTYEAIYQRLLQEDALGA